MNNRPILSSTFIFRNIHINNLQDETELIQEMPLREELEQAIREWTTDISFNFKVIDEAFATSIIEVKKNIYRSDKKFVISKRGSLSLTSRKNKKEIPMCILKKQLHTSPSTVILDRIQNILAQKKQKSDEKILLFSYKF